LGRVGVPVTHISDLKSTRLADSHHKSVRAVAKQAFMRKMKMKNIDIGELTQRSIDNALVEAAGWAAKGNVYWEQGQRCKAIEAFQYRVNCLKWAEGMRSQRAERCKK
jgi:hypothetical protein